MTLGSALSGGDSTDVQDQLRRLQQIKRISRLQVQHGTAILSDGSIAGWWGNPVAMVVTALSC